MTEIDTYQKGNFKLEEWEDVNYCEHDFYKNDEGLTDKEIVDLLNEQEEEIQRLKTMNNELIKTIQGISKDNAETIIKLWTGEKE